MIVTPSKSQKASVSAYSPTTSQWSIQEHNWSEIEEGGRGRTLSIISADDWLLHGLNSRPVSPVPKVVSVGECLWEVMVMGLLVEWLLVCELLGA